MGRYGWRPDKPDFRDPRHVPQLREAALPDKVDLRDQMPPVYDQGDLGSCTANAVAACYQFDHRQLTGKCQCCGQPVKAPDFTPSRLFIYWNERAIENSTSWDSGAEIRDGIKTLAAQGVCPEDAPSIPENWPYAVDQFATQPPDACFAGALKHEALTYSRVDQTLEALKGALAGGRPVAFGFTVYDSFESDAVAASGAVPMPSSDESVLGGHAVVLVGYDEPSRLFLVRNSWGSGWGQAGYCSMPYDYILSSDLCSDFWVVESVMQ